MPLKVLNLYACFGGNRYKWDDVAKIEVTAVELDAEIAELYKKRFPTDTVIIDDAHEYLLKNYKNFDFIWSSPPCPTHSRARFWRIGANGTDPVYPNMNLYEEIIFLEHHFNGKFCVENVIPYYEPMLNPKKRGRHLYWTNFNLPNNLNDRIVNVCQGKDELNRLCKFHDFNFREYKGEQRTLKVARNLVDYEAGKTILETALNIKKAENVKQLNLL